MSAVRFVILSLILFLATFGWGFSQADYNNCDKALYLCPEIAQNVSNHNATKTLCPGCEDDFNYCFAPSNSIWMKFKTNATGGNVVVSFSNVQIQAVAGRGTEIQAAMVQAIFPCDASTYTNVGDCINNANGNFIINAPGLLPLTTYYIVVNGAVNGVATLPAQATMDVMISGNGVQRTAPSIDILVSRDSICENEAMYFAAFVDHCPDTSSYRWFINGVPIAVSNDFFIQTSALKNGDVLSVKTTCFESCIIEVTDVTTPFTVTSVSVNAGPDFTIPEGSSVVLQGSTPAAQFFWTPDFTLSAGDILQPIALPQETTTYALTATIDGCSNTDEMTVFIREDLNITNTFTPNGDGANDTWDIPALENYPNCLVEIYDRWGQLVYQASGYNSKKAWDGRSKGRLLEPSVYFYVIELRDTANTDPIRGSLNLVR